MMIMIQLVGPRDLVYKQLVLSKGHEYLGYKFPLYTRCELRENFHSLPFFDGTMIDRPAAETVLGRAGSISMSAATNQSYGQDFHYCWFHANQYQNSTSLPHYSFR